MNRRPEPSERLLDLIFDGLDMAVESVRDIGSPLIPFLLIQKGESRELERFAMGSSEWAMSTARERARAQPRDVDAVAFFYDGYVTIGGERTDAILVEAHERGAPQGVLFAQRYRPKDAPGGFETVGNPALVGTAEAFLGNRS